MKKQEVFYMTVLWRAPLLFSLSDQILPENFERYHLYADSQTQENHGAALSVYEHPFVRRGISIRDLIQIILRTFEIF